jgi:murein DD-endopeptidase MepM/ murein hydrolase activator NlpD
MNIILVSSRLPTAKTITLRPRHFVVAGTMLAFTVLAIAALLNYATLRYAVETRNPAVFSLLSGALREEADRTQAYLRDNLDAMATRLGEMQAQILRLDTLGERVARLAGFKPQEFNLGEPPARGGPAAVMDSAPLSITELVRRMDFLSRQVEDRNDKLGLLDSVLTLDNAKKQLLPSALPIQGGAYTSNFGWRLDPFTGRQSFHDGIDFVADPGTPILAAAAGVVVSSEYHPQYGNMIEIDHGNGLTTIYAHCSRRLVSVGDVIMKGAKIGEVGSTGRATGPHLHFEVRQNGVAQHPARFLRLAG